MTGARSAMATLILLTASFTLGVAGCSKSPAEVTSDPVASAAPVTAPVAASGTNNASSFGAGPLLSDDQVRIIEPPAGDDVVAIIKEERARQTALGRNLLVYAGAKWCEPCQHFHKAAAAGKLDKAFPKLTLIEFDVDVDGDRLKRAGYQSHFIPLFVVPDENGKPTDKKMEGSVKGDGAVDEIVPRLQRLISS